MIYLIHSDGRFAIVEDARNVARYEQRGFRRCTHDALRAAWRARDEAAISRLWPDTPNPPAQEQAVGDTKPPMKVAYPSTWHH